MVFENKQPMITQQIILNSLSTSEIRRCRGISESARQAMHKGDIQKDKEIAGKLHNVFASVFTLENKAMEKREGKPYYVQERSCAD